MGSYLPCHQSSIVVLQPKLHRWGKISTAQLSEGTKANLTGMRRWQSPAIRPTWEWEQTIRTWKALTRHHYPWETSGKSRIPIITCATLDWSNQSYEKIKNKHWLPRISNFFKKREREMALVLRKKKKKKNTSRQTKITLLPKESAESLTPCWANLFMTSTAANTINSEWERRAKIYILK